MIIVIIFIPRLDWGRLLFHCLLPDSIWSSNVVSACTTSLQLFCIILIFYYVGFIFCICLLYCLQSKNLFMLGAPPTPLLPIPGTVPRPGQLAERARCGMTVLGWRNQPDCSWVERCERRYEAVLARADKRDQSAGKRVRPFCPALWRV